MSSGPLEVLRKANDYQRNVRFDTRFVGPVSEVTSSVGLTLSKIEPLPDELPARCFRHGARCDRCIQSWPRRSGRIGAAEEKIVAWLGTVIKPHHTLISICAGALLAGRAGLLDDHFCTTHHVCCAELAKLAPRAKILENQSLCRGRPAILTSAGVTAGIDLMLHLVSCLIDTACAVRIARALVIYLRRTGADPQLSPWLEGRNHLHTAVHRVQDAIAAKPARATGIWKMPRRSRK